MGFAGLNFKDMFFKKMEYHLKTMASIIRYAIWKTISFWYADNKFLVSTEIETMETLWLCHKSIIAKVAVLVDDTR